MKANYRSLASFSLVLHGWDQKFPFETLLPIFEKYFERVGADPQIGTIKGELPPDMKTYSYRTISKRIKSGEVKRLKSFSLFRLTDKNNRNSEDFALGIIDDYDCQDAYIVNAVSQTSEAHMIVLDFLRDMLDYISPYYGYSLEMPLGHDPVLYSAGMYGHTERALEEASSWQDATREHLKGLLHKEGKFRHVFAINVLSPPHMTNRIGAKSFGNWVTEPGHGTIEQWKDNVWVWCVPKEDRIRCANILQFNGLLTAPPGFENELIG